jgi:alkylation response protein AidB-like acyl-CoA dehydrogenase
VAQLIADRRDIDFVLYEQFNATAEYLVGANYAFTLYGVVGHATGELIEIYGTDKQKRLFLKKMYTGQWSGTIFKRLRFHMSRY